MGLADFVGRSGLRQLILALADGRDLGDGVDAVGEQADAGVGVFLEQTEGVARRRPALFVRSRGQRRETDNVTHRVDVLDIALEVVIDRHTAAVVNCNTGVLQIQARSCADAADGIQRGLGVQHFAALEPHLHRLAGVGEQLDIGHLLAQPHQHIVLLGDVGQRGRNLVVEEGQQHRALIHNGDAYAKRSKHGGVLDADHAGADHNHRAREKLESEDVVAGEDALAIKRDVIVATSFGPAGDDDSRRADQPRAGARG